MTVELTEDRFEGWLEAMHPRLARFEDFLMPGDWTRGYTRESLQELEQYMLQRWPDQESFLQERDADWADGAVRYIGETYLRIAGGGWHLDTEPDDAFRNIPVIRPDTIDGFPVSPYNLMTALLKRRTGRELAKVYDGQLRQVQRRRDVEPAGWEPTRRPVPGITLPEQDPGDSPERDAWVARVDERIAALRASAGERARELDLSPASLPVLEVLAAEALPPGGDLRTPEAREVVARFASYLGEVLLAQAPGTWSLRPGELGDDAFVGYPFVKRVDANGAPRTGLVYSGIELLAQQRTPGTLTKVLEAYAG